MCLVKIMSTSESRPVGSSNKNGDQDFALLDLTYSLVKHDGAGCPSVGSGTCSGVVRVAELRPPPS